MGRQSDRDAWRLIVIPPSHFCEKARWGLDRLGRDYREERHVPLVHAVMARRAAHTTTLPVLVTPERTVPGSAAILRFLDQDAPEKKRLYPPAGAARGEVVGLEGMLDDSLGPAVRAWAYSFAGDLPGTLFEVITDGAPARERAAATAGLPVILAAIRLKFGATPSKRASHLGRIREAFAATDARLADGRPYLAGERFTAADLTLAALGAPAIAEPGYRGSLPPPDALPQSAQDTQAELRETPSGRHIARMYAERR